MPGWSDFNKQHNFEAIFRTCAEHAVKGLLVEDTTRSYSGFGADCNAEEGEVFLTALWSEAPDLEKLKDDIGWISHWEGAFFSEEVFESSEKFQQVRSDLQDHLDDMYDQLANDDQGNTHFLNYSDDFTAGFMETVVRVLHTIQQKTPSLQNTLFLVTDHDELNSESIARLKRITGKGPFPE